MLEDKSVKEEKCVICKGSFNLKSILKETEKGVFFGDKYFCEECSELIYAPELEIIRYSDNYDIINWNNPNLHILMDGSIRPGIIMCRLNNFLSLGLEGKKINIYVKGEQFTQCMFLVLSVPFNSDTQEPLESIDEAEELFKNNVPQSMLDEIPLEERLKAHASNLQAWIERDYDTRILHRNLAFPLLKKLTEVGDPRAKKVFKEEIVRRISSNYKNVVLYLIEENYLDFFSLEELDVLIHSEEINDNTKICLKIELLNRMIKNNTPQNSEIVIILINTIFDESYEEFPYFILDLNDFYHAIKRYHRDFEKDFNQKPIENIVFRFPLKVMDLNLEKAQEYGINDSNKVQSLKSFNAFNIFTDIAIKHPKVHIGKDSLFFTANFERSNIQITSETIKLSELEEVFINLK